MEARRTSSAMTIIRIFLSALLAISLCAVQSLAFTQSSNAAYVASGAEHSDQKRPKVTRRKAGPRPVTRVRKPSRPTRPEFTEQEQALAQVVGFPGVRFWADSAEDYARAVPTTAGPWLILSSGGEDGAFGAGLLNGWTAAGNRPRFPVVTGISTGALMAVYAFAGPKYDDVIRTSYTAITASDIFEIGTTPESLVDTWPLKQMIAKQVTPALLADVSEEYRHGRRLFVLTTNLDAGRSVVWNMGAIAEKGGDDALKLFRAILLASASIPGEFPPVYIEVEANERRFLEMHVDGGVNGPLYVAPESYLFSGSRRLPMSALYIVVNGKLAPEFLAPPRATIGILGRSISLALQMGARMDVVLAYQAAKRDGVDFNLAHVQRTFDGKARGLFDPDYMKVLFDKGFAQAQKGTVFQKSLPFESVMMPREGTGGDRPAQAK